MRCSAPRRVSGAVLVAVAALIVSVAPGCGDMDTDRESDYVDFTTTTTTPDTYDVYAERARDVGTEPMGRRDAAARVEEICVPDPTQMLDINAADRILMETFCPEQLLGR